MGASRSQKLFVLSNTHEGELLLELQSYTKETYLLEKFHSIDSHFFGLFNVLATELKQMNCLKDLI